MGKIISINKKEKKRVSKEPLDKGIIKKNHGLVGDAHAGSGIRQLSLLAVESIERWKKGRNIQISYGDFAENITTKGLETWNLKEGEKLRIGDTFHVVSQVGKNCHEGCSIRKKVGSCIMPSKGVFTKVLRGGKIETGDEISVLIPNRDFRHEEGADEHKKRGLKRTTGKSF